MLRGYLRGDGSLSTSGKQTFSTISRHIVDGIQELALKVGYGAVEAAPDRARQGAYGTKPLYKGTILRERNSAPRIGWTTEARAREVQVVPYEGEIHCVGVPNGTLYVRRNGKPVWCGNTPFEHVVFQFRVRAPLFVVHQWERHRISSFNEESARYVEMRPDFYIKKDQWQHLRADSARRAFTQYQQMIAEGCTKEDARTVLPASLYKEFWWTVNARSLMNFIELRADEHAQWEIRRYAEVQEEIFSEVTPGLQAAFFLNGRKAP
jgi:thymidylate synthase (FAD)